MSVLVVLESPGRARRTSGPHDAAWLEGPEILTRDDEDIRRVAYYHRGEQVWALARAPQVTFSRVRFEPAAEAPRRTGWLLAGFAATLAASALVALLALR